MKCQCPGGQHVVTGDDYVTQGVCCVRGRVTNGCDCTACERLRDESMTYRQKRRKAFRRLRERENNDSR